jgi:Ca2+-transporting ATPase
MIPALALGAEQAETGTMQQPPRKKSQSLLDLSLLLNAFCWLGLIEGIAGMTAFFVVWWSHGYSFAELQRISPAILSHLADANTIAIYQQATTLTLATIVACQSGNVFACRSEKVSIFKLGFFSNRLIWIGIATEWILILSIIYFKPLENIFATAPIPLWQWLLLLIFPPLLLGAEELRKQVSKVKSFENNLVPQ